MNRFPKILLLIPNLGRGGAQQVFHDQLRFFSKLKVDGVVFNWDGAFADDRNSNITSLDIPAGNNWISKGVNFFKRIGAARELKKKLGISISISHLEGADYVNVLSKRKGERTICWVHGSKIFDRNIEGPLGWLRKKILIPFVYNRCDQLITVSEGIRKELIETFGIPSQKIITIYNSFELKQIANQCIAEIPAAHMELLQNSQILITHCRLSRQKNLFLLIDIFQKVKDTIATKLVILGDGELREDLLNYCEQKQLKVFHVWQNGPKFSNDFDVHFLGYERNPFPYLSRASLYVMTSSWEGFPLSLCEAMACGLPVISADCHTGPREIITPDLRNAQPVDTPIFAPYGILMPLATEATVNTWSETITSILSDKSMRDNLSSNARERVKAFDRSSISKQWLKLLEDVA